MAYGGYLFRSKVEAQWAWSFDRLGVQYVYEPDTYQVILDPAKAKTTSYIPDFEVPRWNAFVEIKYVLDEPDLDACRKCAALAKSTGKDVYLFFRPPWEQVVDKGRKVPVSGYRYAARTGAFEPSYQLTECPHCKAVDVAPFGRLAALRCPCVQAHPDLRHHDAKRIVEAVRGAQRERFAT